VSKLSKPQPGKAKLEPLGGGRFRVSGVLDAGTVGELLKQSVGLFAGGSPLEVDLAGVTEADSAGLALLIEWTRMAKEAGQPIRFDNVPGQISALARISEVEDLLFGSLPAPQASAAAASA
jgi:phospholipid transport system transporter-binding protein